jgi:hypothetical protein
MYSINKALYRRNMNPGGRGVKVVTKCYAQALFIPKHAYSLLTYLQPSAYTRNIRVTLDRLNIVDIKKCVKSFFTIFSLFFHFIYQTDISTTQMLSD